MLVATAGHVDHGKTALIRALTGVETDRLPEERRRGISIDLGFAHWRLDATRTISFVDVPGHERFVRNMLAGVSAIDFVLLAVAADDGVMPQTIEHVQILELLGIGRGIVAITKCDRSSSERIELVRRQVSDLLATTRLAHVPIVAVSSLTGEGIAELRTALGAASPSDRHSAAATRNFRIALDRVFSVTGVGTVVTGTVVDGTVKAGARLMLTPSGLEARVRGLQCGGQAVQRIQAGERCALNLSGIEVGSAHRGDWLVVPEMHAPTTRIQVRLIALAGSGDALKHHTPAHLHLGTAAIPARVLIPAQGVLAAGQEAVVQLHLEHPTSAVTGDRFVLRDQSGRHLLGGGTVIDPFVSHDRRNLHTREAVSAALQLPDATAILSSLLAIPGYELDTQRFERSLNLEPAAALEGYRQADAVLLGGTPTIALPATRVTEVTAQLMATLKAFHQEHPEEGGMTLHELKSRLPIPVSAQAFMLLQRELIEKRLIVATGSFVKLASHTATFTSAEKLLWQKILPLVERRQAEPFTARELAGITNSSEAFVKMVLFRRRSAGEIWRITETRFMLRAQIAALAARAAALANDLGGKPFSAAQYRSAIGTGRTLAIQVLEFFDSVGVTHRIGDLRRMRPDYELVVGSALPFRLPSQGPGTEENATR